MVSIKKYNFFLLLICLVACNDAAVTKDNVKVLFSSTPISEGLLVDKEMTKLVPAEGLVYYQNIPFTGTSVRYLPSGALAESITYQAGKKNGYFRKWFRDGTLSFESFYENGLQHGKTNSWWKDGQLRSELNFQQGICHGLNKQWYKSGAKFKEINLVHGKEEGMQKSWRENGKLYNNYEMKNGRIFGLKRSQLCYKLKDEEIEYAKS